MSYKRGSVEIKVDQFICPICLQSTDYQEKLLTCPNVIECSRCLFWFHWNCIGINHRFSCARNKRKKYFCFKCKFDLKDSKVVIAGMSPISCKICGRVFEDKEELFRHDQIFHELTCLCCKERFETKTKLFSHIRFMLRSPEKEPILPYNTPAFVTGAKFDHSLVEDLTKFVKGDCPFCGQFFESGLIQHIKEFHDIVRDEEKELQKVKGKGKGRGKGDSNRKRN